MLLLVSWSNWALQNGHRLSGEVCSRQVVVAKRLAEKLLLRVRKEVKSDIQEAD